MRKKEKERKYRKKIYIIEIQRTGKRQKKIKVRNTKKQRKQSMREKGR